MYLLWSQFFSRLFVFQFDLILVQAGYLQLQSMFKDTSYFTCLKTKHQNSEEGGRKTYIKCISNLWKKKGYIEYTSNYYM